MKKNKIVAIVLCVCVLLATVACSSKGVTESSASGSTSADFSGKVVIMPTMCEGLLVTKKQAEQLMRLVNPENSSGELLIYEATMGPHANSNSKLFGAKLYWCDDRKSDQFQFEWNGSEIYDYSLEDWSNINDIDLSKSGMQLVGEFLDTPYGAFSLYRRPQSTQE